MRSFCSNNSIAYSFIVFMLFMSLCDPPVSDCEEKGGETKNTIQKGLIDESIKKACKADNKLWADWYDRIKNGEIVYYCSADSPPAKRSSCPPQSEWPSDPPISEWTAAEKEHRKFPEECLKALLSAKEENALIPNQGIRLHGYAFNNGLNLSNMKLTRHLSLTGCFFGKDVNLAGIIAPYGISLKNSHFKGCLKLTNADITGSLDMDETECCKVDAEGLKLRGALSIQKANWKEVKGRDSKDTFAANFQGAKIDGQILLDESVFNGDVRMPGICVESQVTAKKTEFLSKLCMQGAIIKRRLCLNEAKINKGLFCQGAELGAKTFLSKCQISGKLDMTGVVANGGIDMQTAGFSDLVLEGAKIIGPLEMQGLKVKNINAIGMQVDGSAFLNDLKLNVQTQSNCSGKVELRCARIIGQLVLDGAEFNGDVHLEGIYIQSQLQAENGTRFNGDVNLQGAKIQRRISLMGSQFQKDLNFQGTEIGAKLFLEKTNIAGKLNMKSAMVNGDIGMANGEFKDIDFITTHVAGQLIMNDCNVSGELRSYGIYVKDIWEFQRSRCMGNAHMHRSEIGSILNLRNSIFFENLSLKGAHIGGDLFFDDVEFKTLVDMKLVTIKGAFIIKNVVFSSQVQSSFKLNLAQINFFDYRNVYGLKYLDLSLTNVGRMIVEVRDSSDWPDDMDLRGFTYKQIRGEYTGADARKEEFFKSWMEQLKKYSPQPFEQCAKVLRQEGHFVKANKVLLAGKQAEREKAFEEGNYSRWAGLSLLRITIGYGIGLGYFWALIWVVLFVFLGTWFSYLASGKVKWEKLWKKENKFYKQILYLGLYSLDMILPVVSLRERHRKIELPFILVIYFSIHKLVGWVLASFIIAGLAGITQG